MLEIQDENFACNGLFLCIVALEWLKMKEYSSIAFPLQNSLYMDL